MIQNARGISRRKFLPSKLTSPGCPWSFVRPNHLNRALKYKIVKITTNTLVWSHTALELKFLMIVLANSVTFLSLRSLSPIQREKTRTHAVCDYCVSVSLANLAAVSIKDYYDYYEQEKKYENDNWRETQKVTTQTPKTCVLVGALTIIAHLARLILWVRASCAKRKQY